jgi:hypothetical protein
MPWTTGILAAAIPGSQSGNPCYSLAIDIPMMGLNLPTIAAVRSGDRSQRHEVIS